MKGRQRTILRRCFVASLAGEKPFPLAPDGSRAGWPVTPAIPPPIVFRMRELAAIRRIRRLDQIDLRQIRDGLCR
jgi:hypothetical protein